MSPRWFADFAEAVDRGEPMHRQCELCGETGVPPRRTCRSCGKLSMVAVPLSGNGRVISHTTIHVSTPQFSEDTPYTVVLAAFDEGIKLTGQLRGADTVAIGDTVALGAESIDSGQWLLTFSPT